MHMRLTSTTTILCIEVIWHENFLQSWRLCATCLHAFNRIFSFSPTAIVCSRMYNGMIHWSVRIRLHRCTHRHTGTWIAAPTKWATTQQPRRGTRIIIIMWIEAHGTETPGVGKKEWSIYGRLILSDTDRATSDRFSGKSKATTNKRNQRWRRWRCQSVEVYNV